MDSKVAFVVALLVVALAGIGRCQTEDTTDVGSIDSTSDASVTEDANVVVDTTVIVAENVASTIVTENDKETIAAVRTGNPKDTPVAVVKNVSADTEVVTEETKGTTIPEKTTTEPEKSNFVENVEKAIDKAENIIRSVADDLKKTTTKPETTSTRKKIEDTTITTKQPSTKKVTEIPMPENVTEAPTQTYKEAEKEITDFVNSILRSLLPQIVGGSGGAKLSSRCTGGMMKVFGYIRRMKGWTLKSKCLFLFKINVCKVRCLLLKIGLSNQL